jgi:antitoxin component of MazEF toxin-antitoxin module
MIGKVQRRDGELIVVIPDDAAKAEGIEEGTVLAIRPAHPVEYMTLDEMLDRITPETLHEAIDWGPDVGKEIVEY